MAFAYDEVPYPGFPFAQTHPDRLATIAVLMGMEPAPVERCAVLELACGDGGNIIPMAAEFPRSRFVGVDLAKTAIASGKRMIKDLRLSNISLRHADLTRITRRWGKFDYIIAHGIYSWVAPEVQDHILRIVRENLAPQGVAFVSYNAFPGARLRQMIREMVLYHTRDISRPRERVSAAVAFMRFLASASAKPDEYNVFLAKELEYMSRREIWALLHDELGEVYSPVYFHEFAGHAAKHGLQYLAEADFHELNEFALTEDARESMSELAQNWLDREQYLDFAKCRRFRQTLLCHSTVTLNRQPRAEVCRELFAASAARAVSDEPDFRDGVVEEFQGPRGSAMKTANPIAKLALAHLIANWPAAVSFETLYTATRALANTDQDLERILFILFSAGLIELHRHCPAAAVVAGSRPCAGKVARYQAGRLLSEAPAGACYVTSLRHASVEVTGKLELELIRLLNGRRDRRQLRQALKITQKQLDAALQKLARAGVLECKRPGTPDDVRRS